MDGEWQGNLVHSILHRTLLVDVTECAK